MRSPSCVDPVYKTTPEMRTPPLIRTLQAVPRYGGSTVVTCTVQSIYIITDPSATDQVALTLLLNVGCVHKS